MKKVFAILAVTVLMVSMISVTAFAHGGQGSGNRANPRPQYALCTVDGCEVVGVHQHGDDWVCSQTGCIGSYKTCTVSGCTELGLHEHNGEYYHCQNYNSTTHSYGHGRHHK